MNNLLWVDDEIELLKPHLLYLRRKGYRLSTATNGHDAVKMVMDNSFDLVILDEMMVGIDGLETLGRIKAVDPSIKAIMVTKSEEEDIFLEAVGNLIDDYLTKPVSPLQLYLSIRKNLEKADIVNESTSKNYIKNYRILTNMIENDPGYNEWTDIYKSMVSWSLRLDEINDQNLADTFEDLRNNANTVFGNFIQNEYKNWISDKSTGPVLSTDIVKKYIMPDLGTQKTAFIVIDCLPYDQMKVIEKVLSERYAIFEHLYFSILPTATQFARNSIFSGLFPSQIEERYPEIYSEDLEDEKSSNKHEKELLSQLLRSCGIDFSDKLKYVKIYKNEEFSKLESHIDGYKDSPLIALVVNMIDFLVHNQKKDELVSEMMENESSYRATIKSWFENSSLLRIIDRLGEMDFKIVITTDHGAKLVKKYTKVSGDGIVSSGLRMKFGKNISTSSKKQTIFWQKPAEYKMPSVFNGMNVVLAKEDRCFLFEKGLNEFYRKIKDTYQHGGVSLEEMILPLIEIKKKK